jgi:hypothetical protein
VLASVDGAPAGHASVILGRLIAGDHTPRSPPADRRSGATPPGGRQRWTCSTAASTPDGVVEGPGEAVFVLRTAVTPAPLDTAVRLVCDWRRGDLW